MAGQLPPFSLEIFDHDQTQLAVLNVTNASEQLTYNNIIGALQVCISVVLCSSWIVGVWGVIDVHCDSDCERH